MWILLRRVEVDAVDQVDDVPEQVAALHPVGEALEHGRDHVAARPPAIAPVAQAAKVREQPRASGAVRPFRPFGGEEGKEVRAGDAVRRGRPVPATDRAPPRCRGRPFRPSSARPSSIRSMSSRNLRNRIQVSIGSRSRSPFSPLSLRMVRRADLMRRSSRCAVVRGLAWDRLGRAVPVTSRPAFITPCRAGSEARPRPPGVARFRRSATRSRRRSPNR